MTMEELEKSGFDKYYIDHTLALWPQSAGGVPWSATTFQSKGDPITDLSENMAAEQKARTTYDNILRLVKDPEVCDPIRFLREREIVPTSTMLSNFCVNVKSYTINVSVKVCASYRIIWTVKTSMRLTRNLTSGHVSKTKTKQKKDSRKNSGNPFYYFNSIYTITAATTTIAIPRMITGALESFSSSS